MMIIQIIMIIYTLHVYSSTWFSNYFIRKNKIYRILEISINKLKNRELLIQNIINSTYVEEVFDNNPHIIMTFIDK